MLHLILLTLRGRRVEILQRYGQAIEARDGIDAARSGPLAGGQQSWLETTVEGPGILRFFWGGSVGRECGVPRFRARWCVSAWRLRWRLGRATLLEHPGGYAYGDMEVF